MAVSIVDWMKQKGMDSSYGARAKQAENLGISGYRGSADQNIKLYQLLRDGAKGNGGTSSAPGAAGAPSANVLAGSNDTKGVIQGVDGGATGTALPPLKALGVSGDLSKSAVTRGYRPSEQVGKAYLAMKAREARMPGDYEESENVQAWRDKLRNTDGEKPDPFRSKYSDQINSLLGQIYGDKEFRYTGQDLQNDDLYQMISQQKQDAARRSMRDTMGNAAALTGGYGSTAAQAAGQQAYDQTMSELNNDVLSFYDRAYQRYQNQQANRYNQLQAFQGQDNTDYGRYRDTVGDWKDDRNFYAGRLDAERAADLNAYQANTANFWNGQNYLAGRYDSERGADFSAYQQDQQDSQWAQQYALQKEEQAMAKEQAALDNELKKLQAQKAQKELAMMDMQMAGMTSGSGGGSGGSGGSGRRGRRGRRGRAKGKGSIAENTAVTLPYAMTPSLVRKQIADIRAGNFAGGDSPLLTQKGRDNYAKQYQQKIIADQMAGRIVMDPLVGAVNEKADDFASGRLLRNLKK